MKHLYLNKRREIMWSKNYKKSIHILDTAVQHYLLQQLRFQMRWQSYSNPIVVSHMKGSVLHIECSIPEKVNAGIRTLWFEIPVWDTYCDNLMKHYLFTTLYSSLWWKLSYINWGYSFSWMAWELCPWTRLFMDHSCTNQSTNWAEFH